MNFIESGQQLSSVDIAEIAGFVSVILALHLGATQAARWIGEQTLGEDFDEERFEEEILKELAKQNDRDFL